MEEEEHEVYGADIPDEGDMDSHGVDVEMAHTDEDAIKELDGTKKRLKEMEEEADALREMQAKVEKEMGAGQGYSDADWAGDTDDHCSITSFCIFHGLNLFTGGAKKQPTVSRSSGVSSSGLCWG